MIKTDTQRQDAMLAPLERPSLNVPPLMPQTDDKTLNILMVEDRSSDMLLTKLALQATDIPFTLTNIQRGDEALHSLQFSQICNPSSLPDVMLLDLGLPGMDGFEMLDMLSDMPASLRAVPIVILTAHKHFDYIQTTYPLHIMDYINKPCCAEKLRDILTRVQRTMPQK